MACGRSIPGPWLSTHAGYTRMISIELATSATPIYQQIILQVKAACSRGDLTPGERLPTVHELAAQLGINRNTVAHAYHALHADGVIVSRPGRGTHVAESGATGVAGYERLRQQIEPAIHDALASGVSPPAVEALVQHTIQHWQAFAQPGLSNAGDQQLVRCLGSHDFCLDLLARQLHMADPHLRLVWKPIGSTAGLLAVGRNEADLAGVHLFDPATGEYNRPIVNRMFPPQTIRLVTLVHREQGLIVRRGNPLNLRQAVDLAQPGVRFASRQPGSGTRVLLDHLLSLHGLTFAQLGQPARELTTHLAVAAAVAAGAADAGLGVRAAAQAFDLGFVPLTLERYDLAFRTADESTPWLAALLEALASPAFRTDIETLAGYDGSRTAWMN